MAFDYGWPLIDRYPKLYRESTSFIDFLFKICNVDQPVEKKSDSALNLDGERELKKMKEKIRETDKQLHNCENTIQELEDKLNDNSTKNDKQLRIYENTIKELRNDLQKSENHCAEKEIDIRNLKRDINEQKNKILDYENDLKEQQNKYQNELRKENNLAHNLNLSFNEDNVLIIIENFVQDLRNQIEKPDITEVNESQLALEYKINEEKILQETVNNLKQNINDKNNEIKTLKSEVLKCENAVQILKLEKNNYSIENQSLKSKIEVLEKDMLNLNDTITQLQEENVNYEKEIESFKLNYSNKDENIEFHTLKDENIELKKELDVLKYDYNNLKESFKELQQKLKNPFKQRPYPYKKNVDTKRNDDEDELGKYVKENIELKSENKILHEKLEEKNQECITLEQQLPNVSGMENETHITVTLMKELLKQLFAHYFIFKFDVLSEKEIILNDTIKNYNERLINFYNEMIKTNKNDYIKILYDYVHEDINIVVEKNIDMGEHNIYKNKDEFLLHCLNSANEHVRNEASKINKKSRKRI
ncbi:hypothetical protein TNCT_730001 [Trichonephila clavata]|uniref:Uncharacterized protein n=1 Tax=Trichonephila clavata TaxID=2740835 RepID=A0A8X6HZM8_TRICU|nr:hypothetical protein TNCT_730001 [Trichonephila clavata]